MKVKIAVFVAVLALMAGVFAQAPVRAQSMFGGLNVDGIECQGMEGAVEHIHTHLQIFNRGRAVQIPAQVGIPQGGSCLYWVHTHTPDGIIHIESPVTRTFTLGQFFDIWGEPLSRTQAASARAAHGKALRVTVNGKTWTGDPAKIPLRDREEIVIQSGPPWGTPHKADWSKL